MTCFDGLASRVLHVLLELLTEPILHKDPWTGIAAFTVSPASNQALSPRNPYPAYFCDMHTLIQTHRRANASSTKKHALRFAGGQDKNPRTYNKPSSAEVSCTVVGEGPLPRHFISVYERADDGVGSTHELSYLSEHVDPLTYPLVHVYGTLGYSHALRDTKPLGTDTQPRHISMREFYAYRFMQRYTYDSGLCPISFDGFWLMLPSRLSMSYHCAQPLDRCQPILKPCCN